MTICLSMIVKNEAHCITRCLESVKPYIDYWVICDTGSTDNTEEVIRKTLDGIPGEIHNHPWEDFATNRNKALSLSKDKADYTLIIDADDYLVVNNPENMKSLTALAYRIPIHHSTIVYSRTQIIHNSVEAKYVGVLHEYLDFPPDTGSPTLEGVHIMFGASGARSQDPDKYYKDALVFEKALESEPDNSRYVFYCAQSYRDANRPAKAITYYTKRAEMGGWEEEVFISLLYIAKLTEMMIPYETPSVEAAYLRAFHYLPTRAESLYYLASYCRKRSQYEKAYFFAKFGSTIKKPKDGLFLEISCYDWKMIDEIAISGYYLGRKAEAAFLNENILKKADLSKEDRDRVFQNLQFCKS